MNDYLKTGGAGIRCTGKLGNQAVISFRGTANTSRCVFFEFILTSAADTDEEPISQY